MPSFAVCPHDVFQRLCKVFTLAFVVLFNSFHIKWAHQGPHTVTLAVLIGIAFTVYYCNFIFLFAKESYEKVLCALLGFKTSKGVDFYCFIF